MTISQAELLRRLTKKKKKHAKYKGMSDDENVWFNLQLKAGLKKKFRFVCKKKRIIASEFIREKIEKLVEENEELFVNYNENI